jgi:hypothetical protein
LETAAEATGDDAMTLTRYLGGSDG